MRKSPASLDVGVVEVGEQFLLRYEDVGGITDLVSMVEDRYYFSTQPLGHTSGENLATVIDLLGPESVMFSSDLPQGAFDSPPEIIKMLKPHFNAETLRCIMGETARDIFDL